MERGPDESERERETEMTLISREHERDSESMGSKWISHSLPPVSHGCVGDTSQSSGVTRPLMFSWNGMILLGFLHFQ